MILGFLIGLGVGALLYWWFGLLGVIVFEVGILFTVFAIALGMVLGRPNDDEDEDGDDDEDDDPVPEPEPPSDEGFIVPLPPNGGVKSHVLDE